MRRLRAAVYVVTAAALPCGSGAQSLVPSPPSTRALSEARPTPFQESSASPIVPTAFSLVVPGAGQHTLGQNRKWLYAAVELAGWLAFFERRSAGGDLRGRYRDYAWQEGRIQSGARVDGDFDYYETLSHWTASGSFDSDGLLQGIQPEMDPTTYNGSIWALASQIYLPGGGPLPETDPAYQAALAYYVGRAYGAAFLWDWSATVGGRDRLADLIEETDDRFRQATTALGIVIANHLVSAVDAFLSARGRMAPVRVGFVPGPPSHGRAWSAIVTIPVGR
jgi:hypothetical protein